ncbi:hypothetical protein FG152_22085 [Ochrobactrum sp. XJ1]|nr:hypothetical protein [Ochrobactrum sp. XJ1]DAP56849.1 MAG TPA: hypothetical protein [Caudoviricetes sp.]
MALYDSIFGYGADTTGLNLGASNPVGSYMQSAPEVSAPAVNPLSTGLDNWNGLRNVATSGVGTGGGVAGAPGTAGTGSGLGFNMGTLNVALQGLSTIGSLWQAWEANKLAKEQFKTSKAFANANLANQIQSYNTALEDRSRSRAFTEGQSAEEAQSYIDKNRLQERQI